MMVTAMLEIIRQYLPTGADEWDAVARTYVWIALIHAGAHEF